MERSYESSGYYGLQPSEFWRMTPRAFYRWATGARRRLHDEEDNELFHLTMQLKGQGAMEGDAPTLRLPQPEDEP